jgi:hypothetical protein
VSVTHNQQTPSILLTLCLPVNSAAAAALYPARPVLSSSTRRPAASARISRAHTGRLSGTATPRLPLTPSPGPTLAARSDGVGAGDGRSRSSAALRTEGGAQPPSIAQSEISRRSRSTSTCNSC